MIIVSQNESLITESLELDIECRTTEKGGFPNTKIVIEGYCIKERKYNIILGLYKTEERAKEVLEEIIELYMKCNCDSYGAGFGYVANTVFKMPVE